MITKDLRYNKKERNTKVAECKCGQTVLLEKKRLAWNCPECDKEHTFVFKIITK